VSRDKKIPKNADLILHIPVKGNAFRVSRVNQRPEEPQEIFALSDQGMEFFALLAWHFLQLDEQQRNQQPVKYIDIPELMKLPAFRERQDPNSVGITASGIVREKLAKRFVISPEKQNTKSWALDPKQIIRVEFDKPNQVPTWLNLDVVPNPEQPFQLASIALIRSLIEFGRWQMALEQLEVWHHSPEYDLEVSLLRAWGLIQGQRYEQAATILEPLRSQASQQLLAPEQHAHLCLMLGRLAWQTPQSDEVIAKENALLVIKLSPEESSIKGHGYLLLGLIELFSAKDLHQFETPTKQFLKALKIFSHGRWWYGLYQSLANFGLTHFLKYQFNQEQSNLILAKDWFERALNVFDALGIDLPDASVLIHLALVLFKLDPRDLQTARLLQRALEVSVKLEHPDDQAQARFELLKISLLEKNVDMAREHRDQILQLPHKYDRLTQLNLEMQLLFDRLT
jgi:tetratricopeptide (TPR) repeat protein